jgi:hypothetical protein
VKLYGYWRSSTSYRVRIALNLKGVAFETIPVDLARGAQSRADYAALNPGEGVPTLVTGEGTVLVQSMAILEWLEETHPAALNQNTPSNDRTAPPPSKKAARSSRTGFSGIAYTPPNPSFRHPLALPSAPSRKPTNQLVDDEEPVAGHLLLEAEQPTLVAGLHQLVDQGGGSGEPDRHALLAGGQPEAEGHMDLAGGEPLSRHWSERQWRTGPGR